MILASNESKTTTGNGNGKSTGEVKGKSEASTVSCQLHKEVHELFRARIEELGTGFTNQSVLLGLIKLWLDGKIELPTPPERLKADAHSALSKLLDMDLSKAEEITRAINDLSKPAQLIKQ